MTKNVVITPFNAQAFGKSLDFDHRDVVSPAYSEL
jgi:hypothetical protein